MTLPASGQIAISDVNTEVGRSTSYSTDLAWIKSVTKDSVSDLASLHGRTYFQRNVDGNCANGNCTSDCNCGNKNCSNCVISGTVNCTNCDGQAYLQSDCNCACTYNCTYSGTTINCDCNCNCDCFWSDDTLKNRESVIENALDIIHQLDGFYYTGNELAEHYGLDTKRDVGVSAQKIKKHFPVALGSNLPNTDAMRVRYERLIPLLLEALKQLDDKVDQIKK
jgi:hypothetical protein